MLNQNYRLSETGPYSRQHQSRSGGQGQWCDLHSLLAKISTMWRTNGRTDQSYPYQQNSGKLRAGSPAHARRGVPFPLRQLPFPLSSYSLSSLHIDFLKLPLSFLPFPFPSFSIPNFFLSFTFFLPWPRGPQKGPFELRGFCVLKGIRYYENCKNTWCHITDKPQNERKLFFLDRDSWRTLKKQRR